ncbi:membrane protein [Marmoricola endophyticus]|uniref:Membrane protein n=1 Tax=Marmoricola endophyticus TaxID=2040280 RepID=A0A917BDA1_9ACTN|nr:ComEC/Rec2 family competence protein [Marmoricola endophyticus]GGF37373.1 membrane protein [Marmoricola endophyticus]
MAAADPPERPRDLRAPALGAVAWLSALAGLLLPGRAWWGLLGVPLLLALPWVRRRAGRAGVGYLGWAAVAAAVAAGAALHVHEVATGPVPALARQDSSARLVLHVSSDPVLREGRFGGYVIVRATVTSITSRGTRWHDLDAPVLVIGSESWRGVRLGESVRVDARLQRAEGRDLAAVVSVRTHPVVVARQGPALRVAERVREGVRDAVAHQPQEPRALIPALVDGDDSGLPQETQDDFRTTGLTHLLAVSGTNLTLVVGALLLLARGCGVRARGLVAVGALGVVGFVLLARPEPSVLRAAVMGSVALLGMGSAGRERGTRALGLAVLVLLLLDPWLAVQAGFALSVLATAGILFLAPGWRDALARWLPRWAAEAVAVPLAAQLACTPVVAAISGQVSLVAVAANLVAAPVVAPATVLGLGGGLVAVLSEPLGRVPGAVAGWCGRWIIAVAHHAAALPSAAVEWSARPASILLLTLICLLLAVGLAPLLARRSVTVVGGVAAVVLLVAPLPHPGWPPQDWVMVACDVGQGDGLVLNAGDHAGVVVDTGPDPAAMDRCLRRLGVRRVPLVVLTHFHDDHAGGLAGVLKGRDVGAVEVTTLDEPEGQAREVAEEAAEAHVPVRRAVLGERGAVADLRWTVLAPEHQPSGSSDSPPNDASIVLLVRSHGISLLLMGDQETEVQEDLAAELAGLGVSGVDVLKVAHHGSAKQDPDLVVGLHPRLAVISVGEDNDYGHPAPRTLDLLRRAGASVRRTDQVGDVAVLAGPDGLRVTGSR